MGQYAEATISVVFNNEEKSKEFTKIINNFEKELKKRFKKKGEDTDFFVSILDVTNNEDIVTIMLDSSRVQNAEWQCDQVSRIAREEFKEFIDEFDSTITTPYGYIYWDRDTEDDEI
jgi:CRISPR/Cas system-associated protein Cas10 (large subunit of type III CRISPR-Cas system)